MKNIKFFIYIYSIFLLNRISADEQKNPTLLFKVLKGHSFFTSGTFGVSDEPTSNGAPFYEIINPQDLKVNKIVGYYNHPHYGHVNIYQYERHSSGKKKILYLGLAKDRGIRNTNLLEGTQLFPGFTKDKEVRTTPLLAPTALLVFEKKDKDVFVLSDLNPIKTATSKAMIRYEAGFLFLFGLMILASFLQKHCP